MMRQALREADVKSGIHTNLAALLVSQGVWQRGCPAERL